MIVVTTSYLRIVHRWDPLSALMGASPGSMAQVIALSTELGADLRAIAIVQTVRVLILVIGLPNGLALFGLTAPAIPIARGPSGEAVLGEMICSPWWRSCSRLFSCGCGFPAGCCLAP